MALFAIADTHLSFGTDKPMDVFRGWKDYVPRLEQNWRALVAPEDTVVIAGDISWGMSLEQAAADFAFLHALPGKKLILKGNHDYWWTTRKKMDAFFAANRWDSLRIVHNDAAAVDGCVAVCGTRGWFFDAEEDADKKIVMREAGRLLEEAAQEKRETARALLLKAFPYEEALTQGDVVACDVRYDGETPLAAGAVLVLLFIYLLYPKLADVFLRARTAPATETQQVGEEEFNPYAPIRVVPNDYEE